jgi:cation-transporting ATPase I
VWTSGDSTHVEVRGVHEPGAEPHAEALRERLMSRPGVQDAQVNAVLGRVVVEHDPDVIASDEVAAAVTSIERDLGLDDRGQAPASSSHPANKGARRREFTAMAAGAAGFSMSLVGGVLPVDVLPPVIPALIALVDSSPRMRAELQRLIGRHAADLLLSVGGAVGLALSRRQITQIAEIAYRFTMQREAAVRRQAWVRWECEAGRDPEVHQADPIERPPRPRPVPSGPVEYVSDTSAALALISCLAVFAATRDSQRALAILLAGVPRAAKVGRDAFAAQLTTDLCKARALVFEPDAMRRLDRVDTVVLDASMLLTGRRVIDDVVVTDESVDASDVLQHALDLIDLTDPSAVQRRDGWTAAPVGKLDEPLRDEAKKAAREIAAPGASVLAVLHDSRPVGVVSVVDEIDPLSEALVEAARHAGTPVLAGTGSKLEHRLDVDRVVPGGNRLLTSVRELQGEGHVVAVVSTRAHASMAAADVGIGVPGGRRKMPWGAHVMCVDRAQACLLLDAVPTARKVSRYSAEISVAGSSLGALLGGFGPARSAPARASYPVQLAALLALAVGTWLGAETKRHTAPVAVDRTPWHAMSPRAVLRMLTSSSTGLDEAESVRRRRPPADDPTRMGLARASMEELANPLTPALAAGAGVSASMGSITDAVMISGVLGLNALIGGAQRLGANRELRRLVDTSALQVRLRRNGTMQTVTADQLVPGDIIELHAGDSVPADCRLLEANGLEVDESSLTGESSLVPKSAQATAATAVADRSSMLYQGTVVAAGGGTGIVVATGDSTELGRTTHLAGEGPPTTGVAARLRTLTKQALPISLSAGAVLLGVDLVRAKGMSQALGRAVSLAVAAVPEGLPFVATVAELASASRLSKRGVLARSPSTIEALGRVDVLCFDKTGTLTEGRITLQQVSDGLTERPVGDLTPLLREVLAVAALASPWQHVDGPLAHPTDRAVLEAARRLDVLPEGVEWIDELPFEPSRGYHAVLVRGPGGPLVSVKGSPEAVLAACSKWRTPDGVVPLDADTRRKIEVAVDRLARKGFRLLAVAQRGASDRRDMDESRLRDLEFCGLLAFADPVRPTAAQAVDDLRRAGVDVVMITGDHPSTAEAIAAELGLLNGGRVMTGNEIEALDDDTLLDALREATVFARVSPEQKALIVRQLHRADRVVAMTGDGANDVPAIRLADVGIALGTDATPAAREAADLVVTDDRIETITDAMVEGRAMWSSVRDALSILLGGNLGEIAFTVGTGLFSAQDALNARQLLLINLLTDVLPAMAMAVRPPPRTSPEELLAEGPEASLGASLNREIYFRAATTAAAATAAWLVARPVSTPAQASTTGLVALVTAQLGQTVAMRGRTPLVVLAAIGSLAALAAVVQVPGVSQFFGSAPLMPHQWGVALAVAGIASAIELLRQLAARRNADFSTASSAGNA